MPVRGRAGARPSPAGARAARRARGAAARRRGSRTRSGSGRARAPRRSAARPPRPGSGPAGIPGSHGPARSSATRIAARRRFAVRPLVSRYTGTMRPTWSRLAASAGWNSGPSKHQVAVAVLDLARDQELVAGLDAALDVAPPEPGGDGEAGAVGEPGRRDLHAPPPRLLDRDVDHANLRRGHAAVIEVADVGERPQLAQVVVPAGRWNRRSRTVSTPSRRATRRRPATCWMPDMPDRGRQQLGEGRGAGRDDLGLERPAAARGRRATALHLAHRRAPPLPLTRRRRGTGSAAGRRGSPRRRPRGSSRAPCARGSPPRRGWRSRRSRSSAGRTPARGGRAPS